MAKDLVARAEAVIDAPVSEVWSALVSPDAIRRYMFGTTVTSDWQEGSPIVWKGEWQGKAYEDRGRILRLEPGRLLRYSHYSPLSGQPDEPESYHTVTIELRPQPDGHTAVSLHQDNNATEQARDHSEKNWNLMLEALKRVVEEASHGEAHPL